MASAASLHDQLLYKAYVPKNLQRKDFEGLTIHAVERVEEAMSVVRGL